MKELWYGIKKKAIQKRIFFLHGFVLILLTIAWLFGITPFIVCAAISLFIIEVNIRKLTFKVNLSRDGVKVRRKIFLVFNETLNYYFQYNWVRFYVDKHKPGNNRILEVIIYSHSVLTLERITEDLNNWTQFLNELISIFEDNGWKKVIYYEKEILGRKCEAYYYQHPSTLSNDNTSENDS